MVYCVLKIYAGLGEKKKKVKVLKINKRVVACGGTHL